MSHMLKSLLKVWLAKWPMPYLLRVVGQTREIIVAFRRSWKETPFMSSAVFDYILYLHQWIRQSAEQVIGVEVSY